MRGPTGQNVLQFHPTQITTLMGYIASHTPGCLSATADVIFKGTVGGPGAPGAPGLGDLKASIMDGVMDLPNDVRLHPGHREPTTVIAEWESNPFIRLWRGLDEPGDERCTVGPGDDDRRDATLLLWAPDYDGGNKALVRFDDDGVETITGGSQVRRT